MCVKFSVWLSKANKIHRRIIKIFVFFSCTLYYNYSLIIYLHLLIACLMQALIHHRFSMSEFWHRNTGCFVYFYYFTQNYDKQNIKQAVRENFRLIHRICIIYFQHFIINSINERKKNTYHFECFLLTHVPNFE